MTHPCTMDSGWLQALVHTPLCGESLPLDQLGSEAVFVVLTLLGPVVDGKSNSNLIRIHVVSKGRIIDRDILDHWIHLGWTVQ